MIVGTRHPPEPIKQRFGQQVTRRAYENVARIRGCGVYACGVSAGTPPVDPGTARFIGLGSNRISQLGRRDLALEIARDDKVAPERTPEKIKTELPLHDATAIRSFISSTSAV